MDNSKEEENKLKINEWVRFGNMDIETVNILNQNYRKPYEVICYHCEQAVEKYLKACLVVYDFPIINTHDLEQLNDMCITKNEEFKKISLECEEITPFAVQIRYPFHKVELTEYNVNKTIKDMKKCCKFLQEILNSYLLEENKIVFCNETESNEEKED